MHRRGHVQVVDLGHVEDPAHALVRRPQVGKLLLRDPDRVAQEVLAQRPLVTPLDQLAHDRVEHRDRLQRRGGGAVGGVLVGLGRDPGVGLDVFWKRLRHLDWSVLPTRWRLGSVRAMFVFKAGVVGAGTMGGEIAHVIADAGIARRAQGRRADSSSTRGSRRPRSLWQARVDAGKLDAAGAGAQARADSRDHRIRVVRGRRLRRSRPCPSGSRSSRRCSPSSTRSRPGHAILASNTSSLSVTEMAQATSRPDRVVGFHFFYPASVMRLIEVIEGDDTSLETVQAAVNFAQAIRKTRDPLRRGAGIRGEPDPELERVRAVARHRRRPGPTSRRSTGSWLSQGRAGRPVLSVRPTRARHRPARRRAPSRLLRRSLLRTRADARAGR